MYYNEYKYDNCCWTKLLPYKPQPNPYNSGLYQRNGWMPPNPFTQSQYVLEHYRPNPAAYCCDLPPTCKTYCRY